MISKKYVESLFVKKNTRDNIFIGVLCARGGIGCEGGVDGSGAYAGRGKRAVWAKSENICLEGSGSKVGAAHRYIFKEKGVCIGS